MKLRKALIWANVAKIRQLWPSKRGRSPDQRAGPPGSVEVVTTEGTRSRADQGASQEVLRRAPGAARTAPPDRQWSEPTRSRRTSLSRTCARRRPTVTRPKPSWERPSPSTASDLPGRPRRPGSEGTTAREAAEVVERLRPSTAHAVTTSGPAPSSPPTWERTSSWSRPGQTGTYLLAIRTSRPHGIGPGAALGRPRAGPGRRLVRAVPAQLRRPRGAAGQVPRVGGDGLRRPVPAAGPPDRALVPQRPQQYPRRRTGRSGQPLGDRLGQRAATRASTRTWRLRGLRLPGADRGGPTGWRWPSTMRCNARRTIPGSRSTPSGSTTGPTAPSPTPRTRRKSTRTSTRSTSGRPPRPTG